MVVKEFLESKGVQLCRFQQFRKEKPAARRKIIRMQGGEISVPVLRTNKEIRETLMVSTVQDPQICTYLTVDDASNVISRLVMTHLYLIKTYM